VVAMTILTPMKRPPQTLLRPAIVMVGSSRPRPPNVEVLVVAAVGGNVGGGPRANGL